jgi:23S rRNA pseudouridine1911/1915/1917 synthase
VDDEAVRAGKRLKLGELVSAKIPKPLEGVPAPEAEKIPLYVLYEDADVVVINKQRQLVVHPSENARSGTLVHALLAREPQVFKALQRATDRIRPGIVHRLDKDTSGCMVIAKTPEAMSQLKASFKNREVDKCYLALVAGRVPEVYAELDTLIGRHPTKRRKMAVLEEEGKQALTRYRVLEQNNEASLVQVKIMTGRTHQIRVHMAHIGHPIIGDELYGGKQKDMLQVSRQMLHQWKLTFPHPKTGKANEYRADLPDDFRDALKRLGFELFTSNSVD